MNQAAARRGAWVGTLGYLAACLLFGLNLPLSAELLRHFDPFWVSPLRYVVASLLLAAMVASGFSSRAVFPVIAWTWTRSP